MQQPPQSHRVTTVKLGTFIQGRRVAGRDITASTAPASPLSSPDLRILRAWIEAEMAHPGDVIAVCAAVETAIRRAITSDGRRVLGRYYSRVPPRLRPLLGQPDGAGLKRLLGDWTKGGFSPGLAELTEREAEVYWLRIRGWSPSAVACELTPARQRYDRRLWLAVQTVYNHTRSARLKVLRAFGLPEVVDEAGDDA